MRFTTWVAGFALGGALATGIGIADRLSPAFAYPLDVYALLAVSVMFSVVGLEFAGVSGARVILALPELREAWAGPPAPVVEYAPEPEDDPTPDDWQALQDAWYTALRVFFRNGEVAGGFSHRKLESTMTEDAWTELTSFYASDDGGRVLRLTPAGYVLGYGWTHDSVREKLVRRLLPCPGGDPPTLEVLPYDAIRRDTRRQATEGVAT